MRRNARVDANQKEIVKALRAAGASVQHLHTVGKGCPDLLVGFRWQNFLFEVKYEEGSLTKAESEWIGEWYGQVEVIDSAEMALEIIGAKRRRSAR